jgi:hypothetical protein
MRILLAVLIGLALCGCSAQKDFQEAERATDGLNPKRQKQAPQNYEACLFQSSTARKFPDLLQRDQHLDYAVALGQWLKGFTQHCAHHLFAIGALHGIACFR